MAEILTQRALVTALKEVTFATLVTPNPAIDSLLVADPDFSVDITTIERNFARQSLSPLPVGAGRKIATMSFTTEVKSDGNFDGATAPRIGRLLRACGYAETGVVTNGPTNGRNDAVAVGTPAVDPITAGGPVHGGSNAIVADCGYRIRVTLGGITGVATMRVTGGCSPEDAVSDVSQEKDAVLTETFCFEVVSGTTTGTPTIDDTTDPESVTYDFTNLANITAGDVYRVTVLGIPFLVTTTGTTTAQVATDVAAKVTANPLMTAAAATNTVTVNAFTGAAASVVVTSGVTVLTLGASGHTLQVGTWTGSLVLNDSWTVTTKPTGTEYTPISTGFESVSIFMYFDGLLHKMSGSRGTFTVDGTGGEVATFSFEMQGNFVTVTDAPIPAATFETTIPQQVEVARLQVNSRSDQTGAGTGVTCDSWNDVVNGVVNTLCANSFSFDQGNNVVARACINDPDSFKGVVITSRQGEGNFDPELELVATHDFWNNLATAEVLGWHARVGTTRGNIVRFDSESAQYSGLSYADRDGIRTLSVDLRFSGAAPAFADDEMKITFN